MMVFGTDVLSLFNMIMLTDCNDLKFVPLDIKQMQIKMFSNIPQVQILGELKE